jgi:molecular chaperone DnaK (HSP70)
MRTLEADYVAIVGCVLASTPQKRSEQYDAILVGPPGIFVLEVKNWRDDWYGDAKFWWRGTERKPSPIAAARRKWEFLKDWLREQRGLFRSDSLSHYWIDYGVVMTHPAVNHRYVLDPSKQKYLWTLGDITDEHLSTLFRQQSAKRIEGYYDARKIADLIAPESSREVLAIDFGTSYSLVGMYTPEGTPHIFSDSFNSKLIPSVFGYQSKQDFIGHKASIAISTNRLLYRNAVFSVKTFLGLNEDEYVRLDSRNKPPNATFEKSELIIRLDRKPFTTIEIAGHIIAHLKQIAESQTARKWTQAVISVPARFNHEQRSAVCLAAKFAGFEIVSLIDEPTAAALAFGLVHQYDGCLAVYDLGGGTFDFSVVEITRGACRERVKLGRLIGGDDFDYRLIADCRQYFSQNVSMDTMADPSDRERFILQEKCEEAKVTLSGDEQAILFLDNWRSFGNLEDTITRSQFEILIQDLVDQTLATCSEALAEAGDPQVKDVLLVGGSTFIPLVREKVSQFFKRTVRSDVDPNSAIVHGAAIKAGILMGRVKNAYIMTRLSPVTIGIPTPRAFAWWSPDDRSVKVEPIANGCTDPALLDVRNRLLALANEKFQSVDNMRRLIQASGVRCQEIQEGSAVLFLTGYDLLYPLIGRNDQIESDGEILDFTQTFTTTADGQLSVPLSVLETDSPRNVWKKASDCRILGTWNIKLTQSRPAGQNALTVTFRIDRDGRLQVAYAEDANPQNYGMFIVEMLYRDHSVPAVV